LKIFFKVLNYYTQHFPFPRRGWKYMRSLLRLLHLEEYTYLKKISPGIYLYVNAFDHIQYHLFWYGCYELPAITLWRQLTTPDAVVIDIGANIGYYSIIAAHKAAAGQVYAFEPYSAARRQLQRNIDVNHFRHIEALPFAVSDHAGTQALYISAKDNTSMTGLAPATNFSGNTETVQTVALDGWADARGLSRIDLLKIDVEGAEISVLSSMARILQRYRPLVFIEVRGQHLQKFGKTADDIYRLFSGHDYQPYEITGPGMLKKIASAVEGDSIIFAPRDYVFPPGINTNS
jgi:FkbM family methyltransferase